MTREEAIQELKTLEFYDRPFDNSVESSIEAHKKSKALTMAIKALEQQPCDKQKYIVKGIKGNLINKEKFRNE